MRISCLPDIVRSELAFAGILLAAFSPQYAGSQPSHIRSVCGDNQLAHVKDPKIEVQRVNLVNIAKNSVGAMEETRQGHRYCSGTLISPDIFLTARHCVGSETIGDRVVFNFEFRDDLKTLEREYVFEITDMIESSAKFDFALLRLANSPGMMFGWSPLTSRFETPQGDVFIIQHPQGGPKQVDFGTIPGRMGSYFKHNVDTLEASSGSGILDAKSQIVGIHTTGGCRADGGGENYGLRIEKAIETSQVLKELSKFNQMLEMAKAFQLFVRDLQGGLRPVLVNENDSLVLGSENAAATEFNQHLLPNGLVRISLSSQRDKVLYISESGEVRIGRYDFSPLGNHMAWRVHSINHSSVAIAQPNLKLGLRWLHVGSEGASVFERGMVFYYKEKPPRE